MIHFTKFSDFSPQNPTHTNLVIDLSNLPLSYEMSLQNMHFEAEEEEMTDGDGRVRRITGAFASLI